jgi:hypothetical protein
MVDLLSPRDGDIHAVSYALTDRTSISIHVNGANIGGVTLSDHAAANEIGQATDTTANQIQSNYSDGIQVSASSGSGNKAVRARIENNLGNGVAAYASGFTVAGSVLNDNGLYGVFVGREDKTKPYAERVRVTGTTFKNNGDLAIRLDGSKTTGKGGNKLQPAPTISQALADGSGPTAVVGSLFAAPNKTYTIEFFAAEEADPSGYGEGEIYVGSQFVTTDAAGNAVFVASGLPTVQKGMWVSATATDPNGNTSEFSLAVVTESNPAPILESMSPDTKIAGSPSFTLIVRGTDFKPGSKIQWDGQQRTTAFISATELRTTISAADIATPRTLAVSVYTPAPGGGVSAPLTFTVANPAPVLTAITPEKVLAGSGAVTVTLNGANFVSGSVVRFNGTDKKTTFVSSTQLTVVLPGSDTATAGTNVFTVFTPGPGGGANSSGASSLAARSVCTPLQPWRFFCSSAQSRNQSFTLCSTRRYTLVGSLSFGRAGSSRGRMSEASATRSASLIESGMLGCHQTGMWADAESGRRSRSNFVKPTRSSILSTRSSRSDLATPRTSRLNEILRLAERWGKRA